MTYYFKKLWKEATADLLSVIAGSSYLWVLHMVNQTVSQQSRKPCPGHCHKKWPVKSSWWTANYANSPTVNESN